MNYAWEFFINVLEALIFFIYINKKLEKKSMTYFLPKQICVSLLTALIIFIMNINEVIPVINALALLFMHYLYTYIFFSSPKMVSFFWSVIYSMILIFADALTTIIPTKVFGIDLNSILYYGNMRIPFTLIYIFILVLLAMSLIYFSSKDIMLSTPEKIIFMFLSVTCIAIEQLIVVSQASHYVDMNKSYDNILYVVFFLVLFLFVSLLIYVYSLGIEKEKNIRLTTEYVQTEMEKKHYEQMISSVSELRYLKHDINNHFETIGSMLANKKYSEVTDYISKMSASINNSYYILNSGNPIIDSIVTNKLIQCKEAQIKVDYTIHLPDKIPVADFELCSILGNMFDNSIEACNKLELAEDKIINFCIKPYKNMVQIMMSNNTNGNYMYDKSHHFLSTKKGKHMGEHGLGLRRIVDITNNHNGIIDITPDETEFKVSILLPLDNE